MGLREIRDDIRKKSEMTVKEADLMLHEIDELIAAFKVLEKKMKKFEKQHGSKIKNSKEYYQKLTELREGLGLPPEIGVYNWSDSPSFMDRLTGKGYYDQLSLDVLEIGKEITSKTGGLISLAELTIRLNKARPGKVVPPDDVAKVVKTLQKNDLIVGMRELDSGVKIVEFVSADLTEDQERVFSIASKKGYVTLEELVMKTRWSLERATRLMESLENEGLVVKDSDVTEGTKYWFPSLA